MTYVSYMVYVLIILQQLTNAPYTKGCPTSLFSRAVVVGYNGILLAVGSIEWE